MTRRSIGFTASVLTGLLLLSSVAMAAEGEGDTLINYGYDEENHILVFNTSATDGTYDCTLQTAETESSFEVAYLTTDGLIEVEGLTSGGSDVMFNPRPADEVGDDFTPATDPADYATATDCQLEATEVSGPNGQINHGMFMKALHSLYDGPHRGCVVRHFAQSSLGKGEQQIQVSEVDPSFVPGDSGTVDFTSIVTDCQRGDDELEEDTEDNGPGKGKGKGQGKGKGRPDSPGKSGSAPGRQGN